jgi:hypothetical protein
MVGDIRKEHKRKLAEPDIGAVKETDLFQGSEAFERFHKSLVGFCKVISYPHHMDMIVLL